MKRIISFLLSFLMVISTFLPAVADTITIPAGVKAIEDEAFMGDTSLDEVVLPDGVETIGERAFSNSSLRSINLPDSLTAIADDAFENTVPQFQANTGTYAWDWVNGFNFEDNQSYHTIFAFFSDHDDIYHDNWIRNYVIENYQERGSLPEWSVELVGETHGASIAFSNGDWAGDGNRAIDIFIDDEPDCLCTLTYRVTCDWEGYVVSNEGAVEYVTASLPTGLAAEDEYHGLKIDESFTINADFLPAGFSFANGFWTEFWTDFNCDVEGDESSVTITPHEAGIYYGILCKRDNNIQARKTVALYIEDKDGNIPATAPALQNTEDIYYNIAVIPEENDGVYGDEWMEDFWLSNPDTLQALYGDDHHWEAELIYGNDLEAWVEDRWDHGCLLINPDCVTMGESVYRVTCVWGGESASTLITLNGIELDSYPSGVVLRDNDGNAINDIHMTAGEIFYLSSEFDPAGWTMPGRDDRQGFDMWMDDTSLSLEFDGYNGYITASEPGTYVVHSNTRSGNVLSYRQIIVYVSDEEGNVPALNPELESDYYWNMILPIEDTKGYDVYLTDEADLSVNNWQTLSDLYGDDFEWLADDIECEMMDGYFTFHLTNFDQHEAGEEIVIPAVLNWGDGSASTNLHFIFVNVELPDVINFDQSIVMNEGDTYRASVSFDPSGWYNDYFLFYDLEDESAFDKWEEEKDTFCIKALSAGFYMAQPHIHASNMFIFGEVFELIVEDAKIREKLNQAIETVLASEEAGSLYIPDNIFTEKQLNQVPQEAVEVYNAWIREIKPSVEEYNEVIDQLYGEIGEINALLGECSYDDNGNVIQIAAAGSNFSFDKQAIDLLQNGNVNLVDGKLMAGNQYILISENGIFLSDDGVSLQPRAPGDEAPVYNTAQNILNRLNTASNYSNVAQLILNGITNSMNAKYLEITKIYGEASAESLFASINLGGWQAANALVATVGALLSIPGELSSIYLEGLKINEINNIISNHGHLTPFEQAEPRSVSIYRQLSEEIENATSLLWQDRWINAGSAILDGIALTSYLNTAIGAGFSYAEKQAAVLASLAISNISPLFLRCRIEASLRRIQNLDAELHYDVTGVVKDRDGNNLPNVEVTSSNALTFTDENGMYAIEVPSSSASIHFEKEKYKPLTKHVGVTPYVPAVLHVEMEELIDHGFYLGTVVDKETQEPIPDVKVTIGYVTDYSDEAGHFSLRVPLGSWSAIFERNGYFSDYDDFTLTEEDYIEEVRMELIPKESEQGTVYGTARDTNGNMLGGVRIQIYNSNNQLIADVNTNESGMYSVEVDPGTYTVTAQKDGYLTENYQKKETRTVNPTADQSAEASFVFRQTVEKNVYNVWTCLFIVEVYKGIPPVRIEGHVDAPHIQISWPGGSTITDESGRCYIPYDGDELTVRCIGHVSYTGETETKHNDVDKEITIKKDSGTNIYWLEVGGFSFRY